MTHTLESTTNTATIEVLPAAGLIGAEIRGVDLSRPLPPETVAAVQQALDSWRVVFFRNQNIDHAAQIAFGRQFGELTYAHPHDDAPPEGAPEIYTVDTRRFENMFGGDRDEAKKAAAVFSYYNAWHSDVTPAINPPSASILRADIVPQFGGDTTFTNLVAAYEGLSEPIKTFIGTLRAEHRYGASWQGLARHEIYSHQSGRKGPSLVSNHPVVRVHPRTGEKALYVNPVFTERILDVSPVESRWILQHLFAQLERPEYQVRFRWEPGSVAFWDNRATAHLAPRDLSHLDAERVLHRVTLIGEVPVGPDGRESELVEGAPFRSASLFAATS